MLTPATAVFARLACAASALALLVSASAAQANEAAWDALRRPGAMIMMRHAIAPGTGDPAGFALGDCATQRNLSDRGRRQARRIGDQIRTRNIAVDRVLSSAWCRATETAKLLAVAPVEPFQPLDSFFADRARRRPQTEATRAALAALPDSERVVLVTHQVNITALTGRPARSGEMIVIDVADDGTVSVLGEIAIPDS